MSDIGLVMGLDPLADALFDAVGSYGANFVEMSLIEETAYHQIQPQRLLPDASS